MTQYSPDYLTLSHESTLIFILRNSGCSGALYAGRIERRGDSELQVYDSGGEIIEYISRERMRSWCIIDAERFIRRDWCSIDPNDGAFFPDHFR